VAINKAKTSVWMKAFIIILIVAFVSSFLYAGFSGLFDLFSTPAGTGQQTTNAGSVDQINARFKPGVDALTAAVASQPTSYTALVNLGNAYFDWAQNLSTPPQGLTQVTTEAATAAVPLWVSARDAYSRAVKIKPGEPPVEIDFAIVTFYSGDATAAIVTAEAVTKRQADFAPAWLNLGVFYEQTGQTAKAIAAYQQYIKLDPQGQNVAFAKSQLTTLQKGTPATSP
jgi:tetratricopeptide (TPR) repeat protein